MAGRFLVALKLAVLLATASPASSNPAATQAGGDNELPEGLLIGAGVSALQTEGAWDTHGKSESQADHIFHMKSMAENFKENPDMAANTYERFREDVAMAKELKLQIYRLSFSWSRLLPDGDAKNPNPEGVEFYKAYVEEIINSGMQPFVTLYHFDHPQVLQDRLNGWENKSMVDKFEEYANFAFNTFGDKVRLWGTMNEPNFYCMYFNALFIMSGEKNSSELDSLRCMQNFILGHMKAYRLYKKDFAHQGGKVGMTGVIFHGQAASNKPEDIYVSELWNDLHFGQIMHPIVYGDYPDLLKRAYGDGMPTFTDDEKKLLTNCTDFIGVNIYNGIVLSYSTEPANSTISPIFGGAMIGLDFIHFDTEFDLDFSKVTPDLMKRGTLWTWQRYGKPIIITENGYGGPPDVGIHDQARSVYLSAYLRTLVSTIKTYKVDVMGYCIWSLIDCFEWTAGYSRVFGLVHIDYENKSLNRTLKDSSKFVIELMEKRVVPIVNEASPSLTPTVFITSLYLWLATRLLK